MNNNIDDIFNKFEETKKDNIIFKPNGLTFKELLKSTLILTFIIQSLVFWGLYYLNKKSFALFFYLFLFIFIISMFLSCFSFYKKQKSSEKIFLENYNNENNLSLNNFDEYRLHILYQYIFSNYKYIFTDKHFLNFMQYINLKEQTILKDKEKSNNLTLILTFTVSIIASITSGIATNFIKDIKDLSLAIVILLFIFLPLVYIVILFTTSPDKNMLKKNTYKLFKVFIFKAKIKFDHEIDITTQILS
ncbi:MAG: hypothetical protein ACLR02_11990 [Clostridium sp.]